MSVDDFDLGDILAIHVDIMGRLGKWPAPLRDEESLIAVVDQVNAARLAGVSLIQRATRLAVAIVQMRPFDDGNFPTAFASLEGYLTVNSHAFRLGTQRMIGQFLRVVAEEHESGVAIQLLEERLRGAVVPI